MSRTIICSLLVSMLLIPIVFTICTHTYTTGADSDWWNSDWIYRRQINFTERSGFSLNNFPVEVSFRHDGHVQADGRDIRVLENNTEIPYSIAKINTTWATLILEVNLTSFSSKNMSIYYGNPGASAPNYPLIPLTISGGQQQGNVTVDNRIFIGWDYTHWGVQPGWYYVGWNLVYIDNNQVVLWTDFRMDFDNDGLLETDEDVITDFDLWKGGIGRYHMAVETYVERSFGLGDYQTYVQTPIYADIVFADVTLRIFRGHNFVETTQADRLQMESTSWNYAKYSAGTEENIIDGANAQPDMWNILYSSSINPEWMAFRDSLNGRVFGGIGLSINSSFAYYFPAKEAHAYDRLIMFDYTPSQGLEPHNQPPECKIYWYVDKTSGYSDINKTAAILNNAPLCSVFSEEAIPEFSTFIIPTLFMILMLVATIFYKHKQRSMKPL